MISIRAAVCLAAAVALAGPQASLAEPESDYRMGRAAFHNDDLMGAITHLRRAVAANHAQAQTLLAYILDRAEEDAAALSLYHRAAEQGEPGAMFGLGSMYASGEGGDPDPQRAVQWYQAAAERGHRQAEVVLAEALLNGDLGLAPDLERAVALLQRGAAAGYEPARLRLSALAARGQ